MEIERKFLVDSLPSDLASYEQNVIEQSYLSYEPEVRIRNKNQSFKLTIKSTGDLTRQEVEKNLSEDEYLSLKQMAISKPIKKIRYEIYNQESDLTYALDIYEGLGELETVEVEFKTECNAREFDNYKPSWFGEDMTYNPDYKNKNLARNGLPKPKTRYSNYIMNKCISNESIIKDKLTKGREYKCIAKNTIGDILIVSDNKGQEKWYKEDFFEVKTWELEEVKVIRSNI